METGQADSRRVTKQGDPIPVQSDQQALQAKERRIQADTYHQTVAFANHYKPVKNVVSPLSPTHYAKWKIEPVTFIMENDIPFCEGNVIKYTMRHRDKNGVQDINKAIRYLEMIKEHEYGIKSTVLPDGVSLKG